mgnify:CR=1 FL=1
MADAIKQEGSKIRVLHLNINPIGDEGTKALGGLKDIIKEVVYDFQHLPITFSTASTTTTSISTTSSFDNSRSTKKKEGKEKEKIMETSTIPSSEVITSVKEQLKAIGFKLSFDEYDKVYSVTTYMMFFDIQSYIPCLLYTSPSPRDQR